MPDLYEELRALILKLNEAGISYALCGGLALAVYGITRATVDMDLLVSAEGLENAKSMARSLGFRIEANPMSFANESVKIHRISKVDPVFGDLLVLDFILVTPALQSIWESRRELEWEGRSLWVVSREGLIAMKTIRGSGQDLDDIKRLQEEIDEA